VNPDENTSPSEQPAPDQNPQPEQPLQPPAPGPQQPMPVEPVPQPAAPQPQPAPAQSGSKGLSIAALVLGIIGFLTGFIGIGILLGLVAIILGIVALAKHKAGKGLAIVGIVTGAMAVVFGSFLFMIVLLSVHNLQAHARTTLNKTDASEVVKDAEAYYSLNGGYPTYQQLVAATGHEALDSTTKSHLHEGDKSSVDVNHPVAYEGCSVGASVFYWDNSASVVRSLNSPSGSAEDC
jgi:hypothetical protein